MFSNKRKMINKKINRILTVSEIRKLGKLDLSSRPSDIKPEIYYKITELIENRQFLLIFENELYFQFA